MTRDMDYLIRTVFGEAGAEPPEGQRAVAAVLLNRARQTGQSIEDVALAPGQFEPWGNDDSRRRMEALTPGSPEYARIAMTIAPVLGGQDPTGGADHFYSPTLQAKLGRRAPAWDNGSGQDIGRHRFFKLGYGGAGRPAEPAKGGASGPSGADIFGFGDDEHLAGGDGGELPSGADIFGLEAEPPAGGAGARPIDGEVLDDAQATALNARGLPYASRFRGRLTQEGLPRAQDEAYGRLADQNKLDFNAKEGSEAFPAALTTSRDKADLSPGTWYIDLDGNIGQVPSLKDQHADDSWLKTAVDLGQSIAQPVAYNLANQDRDPRAEAIRSGVASGFMLGGKNEAQAALAALPEFAAGGLPAWQRALLAGIDQRDAQDANLREAFPIAHGAGAVTGGLIGGAIMPEMKGASALATAGRAAVNTGVGAAGGFLSTDGSVEDRAKGAAIGGGLGLALAPLMKIFGGATRAGADLSAEKGLAANAALEQLGSSTSEMSDLGRLAMRKYMQEGIDPTDAARMALAQDLPAPVPMTRGQVTGLPGDQLDFNMALRGGAGPRAAEDAQGFVNSQQDALRLNLARIAGGLADGEAPMWGGGGEAASAGLNAARDSAKRGVDAAYDAARAAETPAILPKYDADALAGQMFQRVADFDPMRIGSVQRELDRIAMLSRGDVDLRKLFDARSRLTKLRISNEAIEAHAASEAVKGFDDFVGDALSNELFHGDPETVQLWRTAIGKRRDFGEVFQAGDLVERLTEKTGYGGARRLRVDPGDAGNLIFGRSELGSVGRANLYRDLGKIKSLVDADTWNQLRAEHFVRIAQRGEGVIEGGAQQFSGAKFLKAWNDAKAKDMRLVQSLYSPEEIDTINRFAAISARVTNPVKGGDNSSNTAVAAMKTMGNFLGGLAKAAPLVRDIAKGIEEAMGRSAAKAAMKGEGRTVTGTRSYQIPGRASAYVGSLIASEKPQ